jgi:hypothetical protein
MNAHQDSRQVDDSISHCILTCGATVRATARSRAPRGPSAPLEAQAAASAGLRLLQVLGLTRLLRWPTALVCVLCSYSYSYSYFCCSCGCGFCCASVACACACGAAAPPRRCRPSRGGCGTGGDGGACASCCLICRLNLMMKTVTCCASLIYQQPMMRQRSVLPLPAPPPRPRRRGRRGAVTAASGA